MKVRSSKPLKSDRTIVLSFSIIIPQKFGSRCDTSVPKKALDTDMIILNANLADGADFVSPVVMAKLIDNPETVLVIYGEVSPVLDALATVLEASGIAANNYCYEKVQVCYWLPGAGKTGKGGFQVRALVLVAGVKFKKKVCTMLLNCEASQCL